MSDFKANVNRQPQLLDLVKVMELLVKHLDTWIANPKLIEVIKEVEKVVEVPRLVVVPSENKDREMTLTHIL